MTHHDSYIPGQTVALRRFLRGIEQGWSPPCDNYPAAEDEWGVLKAGCVNGGAFNEQEQKFLPPPEKPIPELEIKPGDLLISRANTRELVGSVAYVSSTRSKLILCDKIFRLRLDESRMSPRFLAYSLQSASSRRQIEANATGASSSMQNIGQDCIRDLTLFVPALTVQERLANFLDSKTASIRALIAKKEDLAAILEEKREALIAESVSVGLGATKEAHRTVRLDQVIHEVQRPVQVEASAIYREIGVRSHGRGIFHKEPVAGELLDEKKVYWIHPGDLIFNIVFAWERAVAVAAESEQGMIGSHRFPTYRPIGQAADIKYLRYFFLSELGRTLLDQNSPGAAGRNRTLDRAALLKEYVPMPPLDVQRAIAEVLDRRLDATTRLVRAVEQSVKRLQEFRQALITAAVTGQLDVAERMADEAQEAG